MVTKEKNSFAFQANVALVLLFGICISGLASAADSTLSARMKASSAGHSLSQIEEYAPNMDMLQYEKIEMPEPLSGAPKMSKAEYLVGRMIYFERCAGCHGVLRQGATGGAITPDITHKLGFSRIKKTIYYGSGDGMPNWGEAEVLSDREVDILAKYLMHTPPKPNDFNFSHIRKSWKVLVPRCDRPQQKANDFDIDNLFAITMRDTGKVALIDGTSKKIIQMIDTGYAVHVTRMSASGRYLYIIARDGNVNLIDLWMKKPATVAKVRVGYEARSIQASKMAGWEDKFVVAGSYWPPQFTMLNGETLQPLKVVSTRGMTHDTMEYHHEPRVASIASSRFNPEFIINIKETGKVLLVNYADIDNLTITTINAERYLHDGGFDPTKRYFLVAANAKNTVAVIDTKTRKLVKLIRDGIGDKPHPGHGANFNHPEYGPVWATSHLGDNSIALIGVDPENHPQYAWQVVQVLNHNGAGSLFARTHPKSRNLWVDAPLNQEAEVFGAVSVFDINDIKAPAKVINLAEQAGIKDGFPRIIQGTYNRKGDEVWFSVWNTSNRTSAIVIVDDVTRTVKKVIKDPQIITPTGKFNTYVSRNDVY